MEKGRIVIHGNPSTVLADEPSDNGFPSEEAHE
jgi:hypothetical protein